MRRTYLALLMLALASGNPFTVPAACADESVRPKIGLALSGGGARGAAHIGVLRELERLRIPIDYIAGTSMGSIIGGLYAAGMTPDELQEAVENIDWDGIFVDDPPRADLSIRRKFDDDLFQINKSVGIRDGKLRTPSGLIQGQKFSVVLRELTTPYAHVQDFDKLRIPFRAVAADIATGAQVVIGSGNLATALRASMAVPGAFASVHYRDKQLVDGGIANNLPVSVVRDMGADVVIAVDISTPLLRADQIDSALSIVLQLSSFLTRRNTEQQIASLGERDILIVPELGDLDASAFKRGAEAVQIGARAVSEKAESLARLSLPEDRYADYLRSHQIDKARIAATVAYVRINNDSSMADAVIESKIKTKAGDTLSIETLEQDLNVLYGLDVFESVTYDLISEKDQTGVVFSIREKSWGPRYLQFGLDISTDVDSDTNFGLKLGYTVTPINRRNGEWRTIVSIGDDRGLVTEWYQPVRPDSPYFFNPLLFLESTFFNFRDEENRIVSQRRTDRIGLELAAGREFGNRAQLRFGLRRYEGDNELRIGTVGPDNESLSGGELFADLRYDSLDNLYFPNRGMNATLGWLGSRTGLGADQKFNQFTLDFVGALPYSRYDTFLLGARYYTTVNGDAPTTNRFRTGGLFELPGFNTNSLSGQQLVLLRGGYFRRLRRIEAAKTYFGFTLQAGNVFESEGDINSGDFILAGSAFIGVDSLFGPIYFGAGWNDKNETAYYFSLGPRF